MLARLQHLRYTDTVKTVDHRMAVRVDYDKQLDEVVLAEAVFCRTVCAPHHLTRKRQAGMPEHCHRMDEE